MWLRISCLALLPAFIPPASWAMEAVRCKVEVRGGNNFCRKKKEDSPSRWDTGTLEPYKQEKLGADEVLAGIIQVNRAHRRLWKPEWMERGGRKVKQAKVASFHDKLPAWSQEAWSFAKMYNNWQVWDTQQGFRMTLFRPQKASPKPARAVLSIFICL